MKLRRIIFYLFITAIFSIVLSAQDLHCELFISKPLSSVIEKFGKPAYKDESNPDMVCIFYKDKTSRKVFVAGKNGIYQSESWAYFTTKNSAADAINKYLNECGSSGFVIDTLNSEHYTLAKKGVKLTLEMSFNKNTNNYELKSEAHESED